MRTLEIKKGNTLKKLICFSLILASFSVFGGQDIELKDLRPDVIERDPPEPAEDRGAKIREFYDKLPIRPIYSNGGLGLEATKTF